MTARSVVAASAWLALLTEDQRVVAQLQQPVEDRIVLRASIAVLEIGAAGAADQKRIAGEYPIAHQIAVGIVGMTGRVHHVETEALVPRGRADGSEESEDLENRERPEGAEGDRRQDARRLDRELPRVAEEKSVRNAVPRLLREDAGRERPHRAADAVGRHDVQRVVQARACAPDQREVARERRGRSQEESGRGTDETGGRRDCHEPDDECHGDVACAAPQGGRGRGAPQARAS